MATVYEELLEMRDLCKQLIADTIDEYKLNGWKKDLAELEASIAKYDE